MKTDKRPILITGSHRSGSTWAGKILSSSPKAAYIQEPFNTIIKLGVTGRSFDNWYQYISDENSDGYKYMLEDIINFQYPFRANMGKITSIKEFFEVIGALKLSYYHRRNDHIPIIKDPIAFFSAEWLSSTFNMDVLVLIRHPAAFCSSLKIKNWKFDFNNFLNQPLLMEGYLSTFRNEIHEYAKNEADIIDQAILLWNCIHHTIQIYKLRNPSWVFVRHEDLSLNPIDLFRSIFKSFNLDYTDSVKSLIIKSTGAHNPVEQQLGNEFVRDSRENIHNWKSRLSENEISKIKEKTSMISTMFYTDGEWL